MKLSVVRRLAGALMGAACFLSALGAAPAAAQDRTLRILVGFPAGAGLDAMTRMVAEKMRVSLGYPVVVENRPGAGGRLVMEQLKAAPADGTTLVMTPLVTVVTAPHVYKELRYDAFADFAPVAHTANFLFAFAVGPEVPAKTLADYVALVKRDPKHGNFASAAPGSLPHFFALLFADKAGIAMNHIGYRGTAPAMTDLMGGQISAFMGTVSDLVAQHKAGKVRVLATSGAQRARDLPDVPTFAELGYSVEGSGWYAAYAPAKTPRETIDRLSAAMVDALRAPDVREKLQGLGMDPTGLPAADLARIHKQDFDKWGPVIRASGFKPES
jgi:tripartite-type tricarboxylate transporter receptor subunit TctC